MTYTGHTLVEFTGTWTYSDTAAETWAFGIRLSVAGPDWGGIDAPDLYIAAVGPTLKTWWGTSPSCMASTAKLGLIKCNNIDALGHYVDPVTHSYDGGGQLGTTSMALPITQTSCWSWTTGRSSGRARHGRIYPPLGMGLPGGGATVGGPPVSSQVTAAKALLSLLAVPYTGSRPAPVPVICSKIDGSVHPITGVSVDNRIDIQRRRTKQVVGTRTTSSWP